MKRAGPRPVAALSAREETADAWIAAWEAKAAEDGLERGFRVTPDGGSQVGGLVEKGQIDEAT